MGSCNSIICLKDKNSNVEENCIVDIENVDMNFNQKNERLPSPSTDHEKDKIYNSQTNEKSKKKIKIDVNSKTVKNCPSLEEIEIKNQIEDGINNNYKTFTYKTITKDISTSMGQEIESPFSFNKNPIDPSLFVKFQKGEISNFYKFGKKLGEGGYGQVYLVSHKQTGTLRALKIIEKSSIRNNEENIMLEEINILKNLDHPNIVKIYELYQDTKKYYLITEYYLFFLMFRYLKGGMLLDKINRLKNFSEKVAADYMKMILSGLCYCHDKNIVHRDLKPENIIFDSKENGILKIIDFGTSSYFKHSKKLEKRVGTIHYIAPEVLNKSYNEKCDVWSCGVILYLILCGYHPFNGKTECDILSAVQNNHLKFPKEDWSSISKGAKLLIKKMLERNPSKRISAHEAINDKWIQQNSKESPINSSVLEKLSKFTVKCHFKTIILNFLSNHFISADKKNELLNTFQKLDKNKNGQISYNELINAYGSYYHGEDLEEKIESILDNTDFNKSGKIDFSEFLFATTEFEKKLNKETLEAAFKLFDLNDDGYITKEELEEKLFELDENHWKYILSNYDLNGDGKISKDEFVNLFLNQI